MKNLMLLILFCLGCFLVVEYATSSDDSPPISPPERVIQYDEGIFGKINLHDLANTQVTTYSPLIYVKRPGYVSQFANRMAIDKGQKHFFKYEADREDSRYVYNYLERDLNLLDSTQDHTQLLRDYFHDLVAKEGVAANPMAKRLAMARSYDLEILLNFRINDVHWGGPTPAKPELQSEFWLNHPEYYVNPSGTKWKDGALNVAIPEVQEYLLQFYKEAVNLFDNDGILIDMMRNPTLFPPGTGWENRGHMTEFLHKVRQILDQSVASGEARPVLGIKVPPTLAYCEREGMDVRTWMEEGLVDFISIGTFIKQDPNLQVKAFRNDLGNAADFPLYATIQRRNYGHAYPASFGQYRGMIANMLGNETADGLLLFNFMETSREMYYDWVEGNMVHGPHQKLWKEIGSLETLAGRNKVYSIAWGYEPQYPDLPFFHPLPVSIPAGETTGLYMGVYEDLANQTPERLVLCLQFRPEAEVNISWNGTQLSAISAGEARVPIERITGQGVKAKAKGANDDTIERIYRYFQIPVEALEDGRNTLNIEALNSDSVEVIRADLFVGYGPEETHGYF
ncbi:MAG: hypothetical protein AAF399_08375 [Bacteroidota bacterium]